MADKSVSLRWTGQGMAFEGGAPGAVRIPLDSDGVTGPSPMDALLLSLAGCMGIDILMILQKGRVPVDGLELELSGDRAPDPPRRFTRIVMVVKVAGPAAEHQARIQRAVDLSRDTYCSVFHTLRTDLEVEIVIQRT